MVSIRSGLLGGFAATFAASAMMLMNNAIGRIPELHLARTTAALMGSPDSAGVGWLTILGVGIVVLGLLYAVIAPRLPLKSSLVKGLLFGAVIWLALMLAFMPAAGAGFFAVNRGTAIVPAATLVVMLVYGAVLAAVHAWDVAASQPIKRTRSNSAQQRENVAS
jgi:hypothetical protein